MLVLRIEPNETILVKISKNIFLEPFESLVSLDLLRDLQESFDLFIECLVLLLVLQLLALCSKHRHSLLRIKTLLTEHWRRSSLLHVLLLAIDRLEL